MRKKLKYLIVTGGFLFLLLNILIAVHSYRFTHFVEGATPLSVTSLDIPFSQKIKMALFGIDIPKPKSNIVPQSYDTICIPLDEDKYLRGWYLKTDSLRKRSVLLFHGYGDQKSSMLSEANEILYMGYDVYMIDFMGAGDSYGIQTTIGYYEAENVIQTYEYLYPQLKGGKIFLSGFSMGAVAIMKAMHDKPLDVDGIILEAPYSTLQHTIGSRAKALGVPEQPASALFTFWIGAVNGFDAFDMNPIDYVKDLEVPVLLMCGSKDQHISNQEINNIYDAIKSDEKKLVLFQDSKHESYLLKDRDEWVALMCEFLWSKN